jgi:hypothetical protein
MADIVINSGVQVGNRIEATGSLRWEELGDSLFGTWADWTDWNPLPNDIDIEVFQDAGSLDAWTPTCQFNAAGTVTVELQYGNTLDSNEEIVTPTTVSITDTASTYGQAQYFQFNITVSADSATPAPTVSLPSMSVTRSVIREEYLKDVDTSTLASDSLGARELDTTIGVATTMTVTAHQEGVTYANGEFQDRVYAVPDDYIFQENAIVVNIVSKSPPTIRCFDLNGESIDAIIDARIVGLPSILLTQTGVEIAT